MGEGGRLRQLLEEHGFRPGDLSRVMGVTSAAVSKYWHQEKFDVRLFARICDALEKMKIDPALLRPGAAGSAREVFVPYEQPEDNRHLLANLTPRQLENVLKIIDSTPNARNQLRLVILDRIERQK